MAAFRVISLFSLPIIYSSLACSSSSARSEADGAGVAVAQADSVHLLRADGAASDASVRDRRQGADGGRTDVDLTTGAVAAWIGLQSEFGDWTQRADFGTGVCPGVSGTSGSSVAPAVVVDDQGRTVVAWADRSSGRSQIYLRRWTGTEWEELDESARAGGISDSSDSAWNPAIALDGQDRPIVVWEAGAGATPQVYLRRWTGSVWEELAGSASGKGISMAQYKARLPRVATDRDGNPIVAWEHWDDGKPASIYLRRWHGQQWEELGGSASDTGVSDASINAFMPDLTVDKGDPIVVWEDAVTPSLWTKETRIYLKRWHNGHWEQVGASATGDGIAGSGLNAQSPQVVLDSENRLAVAWVTHGGSDSMAVALRRWDGKSWAGLSGSDSAAGISSADRQAQAPVLVPGPVGTLFVAWDARPTSDAFRQVYMRRWNGQTWQELDGSATRLGVSAAAGEATAATMAVDGNGHPRLAWADTTCGDQRSQIYLRWHGGKSWSSLEGQGARLPGGLSDTPGPSSNPALVLGAKGDPFVAWVQSTEPPNVGAGDIYLRHWNGRAWEELEGSGSAGGVSKTATAFVAAPAVALDNDGYPLVLWTDRGPDFQFRAYLRRWNGRQWVDLGGSASGTGLGTPLGPVQMMMDKQDRPVVAWAEPSSGSTPKRHVARWEGDHWNVLEQADPSAETSETSYIGGVALAIDIEGRPLIAYGLDGVLRVEHWSAERWELAAPLLDYPLEPAEVAVTTVVALQVGKDGAVLVALLTATEERALHLWQWDGTEWTEHASLSRDDRPAMPSHRATGLLRSLSLAQLAAGQPIVVWQDETTGAAETFLLYRDQQQWKELPTGSASNGGLSNSAAASRNPVIAVRGNHVCVAWDEPAGVKQIVMRCTTLEL